MQFCGNEFMDLFRKRITFIDTSSGEVEVFTIKLIHNSFCNNSFFSLGKSCFESFLYNISALYTQQAQGFITRELYELEQGTYKINCY